MGMERAWNRARREWRSRCISARLRPHHDPLPSAGGGNGTHRSGRGPRTLRRRSQADAGFHRATPRSSAVTKIRELGKRSGCRAASPCRLKGCGYSDQSPPWTRGRRCLASVARSQPGARRPRWRESGSFRDWPTGSKSSANIYRGQIYFEGFFFSAAAIMRGLLQSAPADQAQSIRFCGWP